MLHNGALLIDVMRSAFGNDDKGRAWQRAMHDLLAPLPTTHKRRRVLGFFLRWFSYAVRHGSQWRVVDARGFVGHKTELRQKVEVFVDDCGELHERTGPLKLHHVPAARAGGLAAHEHCAPRTLDGYKRHLRGADETTPRGQSGAGGLVRCKQPPFHAPDAVRPRAEGSKWAYAQAWLLLPPSAEMLRRWGGKAPPQPVVDRSPSFAQRVASSDPCELAAVLRELRET